MLQKLAMVAALVASTACTGTTETDVDADAKAGVLPVLVRNAFPAQDAPQALIQGLLVVDHAGCIRIGNAAGDVGPFVIWHYASTIARADDGRIRITDGFTGNTIHIGEEIALGGSGGADAPANVTPDIPAACAGGDFWLAGQLMSDAERQDMIERNRNRTPVPLPPEAESTLRE